MRYAEPAHGRSHCHSRIRRGGEVEEAPLYIRNSLRHVREDYPDLATMAFILMQFRNTKPHEDIVQAVKKKLANHGVTRVRKRQGVPRRPLPERSDLYPRL